MTLWVVYDSEGIPVAVFDRQVDAAEYMGITDRMVRKLLSSNSPRISKVWVQDDEDEES